ncbi:MAG TPA: DinB family protein [Sphingobacteriaceae bacterium]
MTTYTIDRLESLCETVPTLLRKISEADFSFKPTPEKWSKKEILGHLIDSATNNHHRFIRGQFENVPVISYDQNKWNEFNYYQQIKVDQLIQFWTSYNLQLLELLKLISPTNLKKECNIGGQGNVKIESLFNDYVSHLEHHLGQIIGDEIRKTVYNIG